MGHEAILLGSAFSVLDEMAVIERRQVTVRAAGAAGAVPVQHDAGAAGAAAPRLAAEIEALLLPLATDGMLTEVIATNALIARRRQGRSDAGFAPSPDPLPQGEGESMRRAWEARRLLRAARVGTLASAADGQPFASLVTPACAPDLSLLLLLSDLSEHTRHLRAEPRCSVLVAGRAGERQSADRAARHASPGWPNGWSTRR